MKQGDKISLSNIIFMTNLSLVTIYILDYLTEGYTAYSSPWIIQISDSVSLDIEKFSLMVLLSFCIILLSYQFSKCIGNFSISYVIIMTITLILMQILYKLNNCYSICDETYNSDCEMNFWMCME